MSDKNLLLYNGNFITLDNNHSPVNWIYVHDGYIADMGAGHGYEGYMDKAECLDLKGKYGIPGFVDSHVHLVQTGLNVLANNLSQCKNIQDVLESLETAKVEKTDFGDMIRCVKLEEIKLREQRMPTRWEIDKVQSDKMVWITSVEYQISIVNTFTYKLLNLPFNLEGIERNEMGLPTGVLIGKANFMARKKLLGMIPDSIRKLGIDIVLDDAIKKGVTTIDSMEGGFLFHERDAHIVHKNIKHCPIDVELFFQTIDISKVEAMGLKRIGGSILLDGSFQARTAALESSYSDMETCGDMYFSDADIEEFIFTGFEKGLDTMVHAVGEKAIDQILKVYKKAKKIYPESSTIMRIAHFELPGEDHIKTATQLGVILSVVPSFEYYWGGLGKTYEKRLGKDRIRKTNPYATIIANGGILAGSSESDLTPLDPLLGMHAALNHPTVEERITPMDALKMFTLNGAIAIGQHNIKGKLEIGYKGDICILDKNILKEEIEEIKDISVLGTIKSGEILFLSEEV